LAEPVTLVRSPIITKPVVGSIANGSRPLNRVVGAGSGTDRGATPRTAPAICSMCAGVVPQQPPTMLTMPAVANSPISPDVWPGVSS
jgi:hypothetical protein